MVSARGEDPLLRGITEHSGLAVMTLPKASITKNWRRWIIVGPQGKITPLSESATKLGSQGQAKLATESSGTQKKKQGVRYVMQGGGQWNLRCLIRAALSVEEQ